MMAHYDTKNPEALLRLIAAGVDVSLFPPEVIETIYAAAQEHYAGLDRLQRDLREDLQFAKGVQGPELPLPPGTPTSNTMRPCCICGARS